MKLVTYTGMCKSITKHGHKFTDIKRTCIMDNDVANNFENFDDFTISVVPESMILGETKKKEAVNDSETQTENQSDTELESKKKRLMKMNLETLKEMCNNAELSDEGKKEELVDRLLTPLV